MYYRPQTRLTEQYIGVCQVQTVQWHTRLHQHLTSQKPPGELRACIESFHAKALRERRRGSYNLCDLANMDHGRPCMYQTPLPFVLEDNKSYDTCVCLSSK